MEKLNLLQGYQNYQPGTENRLTWSLMNLLRISPFVRAAFLDLVREQQKRPIRSLTTLQERECIVQTQVKSLVAEEGRLVAIGITAEGGEVDVEIRPKDREAVYDGVVTFIAPEVRQHRLESLTLTVESKLGPEVGSWQLMPNKAGLGEIEVDRQAVILKWRDILGTLSDLDLRGLLGPAEQVLIQDFLDYVAGNHTELNPFDHFALCRDNPYLLRRRCEAILREIEPEEAWHRSTPIIAVGFPSFRQIWLEVEEDEGLWKIRLGFAVADTMEQARPFWKKVDQKSLLELQEKGCLVAPNLHFSYRSGLHWAETPLSVEEYVELWKSRAEEIASLVPDKSGDYRHNWTRLVTEQLIYQEDVEALEAVSTGTARKWISMSPGMGLAYKWSGKQAAELDRDGDFVHQVKERIREATETWGEVPDFCRMLQ